MALYKCSIINQLYSSKNIR